MGAGMKHRVGFCKDCKHSILYEHHKSTFLVGGCTVDGPDTHNHWNGSKIWPNCEANYNLDCPNFTPKEPKWWEFWK